METLSGQVGSAGRVSQTHLKHNVEANVTRLGLETRTEVESELKGRNWRQKSGHNKEETESF